MNASKSNIHLIFNSNRILEIPFFQRPYVWKEDEWKRFLDDMIFVSADRKPYFLGSIILKQISTSTNNGDRRTVIDGQQRLTTFAIFIKVLSLKLKNPEISRMLRIPLEDNAVALQHSFHDYPSFNKIIELESLKEISDTGNIADAYRYFKENLDEKEIDFKILFRDVTFIAIDLDPAEDEQQIFDTINSLGVKLTTAELLKNHLFKRSEKKLYDQYWFETFEATKKQKSYWDTVLYTGRFRRTLIDLFFYSYLQIKIQDPALKISSTDRQKFSKVDGLFQSYKTLFEDYKIDKVPFLKEVKAYAETFHNSFNPNIETVELSSDNRLDRICLIIFSMETTTLLPYVLYVLKNAKEAEIDGVLEYLESYVMRRMVCRANTKNYNQLFSERLIFNKILTRKKLASFIEQMSDQINYMPTDSELMDGFNESKLSNKQAAGVLYLIESKIRNPKLHSTALMGFQSYSLEHLMPKKWTNNWNSGLSESQKTARDRKLLTIGNLSLLSNSLNSSIRDAAWDIKKSGAKSGSGLEAYASGLETVAKFIKMKKWNEAQIEARAKFLYEKSLSVWPD